MKIISSPYIEFKTDEELWNVIPEPYPASHFLPEWLKKLPPTSNKINGLMKSTVKRCAPFIEAINLGWIIPTPADFELKIDKSGNVEIDTEFKGSVLETHHPEQMGNEQGPCYPFPPLKFINYWSIKVPKGYSVLVTTPFNRYNNVFELFSGVVECDKYWNNINFPGKFVTEEFCGVIKRGTPLAQIIPFPRAGITKKYKCSIYTKKEANNISKTQTRLYSQPSFYREEIWKKDGCPFKNKP